MFNGKELLIIVIALLVLAYSVSLVDLNMFFINLLLIAIIVAISLIAKKMTARHYETDIKVKFWGVQQFGLRENWKFKQPFPVGIFLPIILSFASYGHFYWLAALQFDEKPLPGRRAKRHGYYSFSELTEWHIGLIAASGVIACLIAAVIAYFIDYPYFMNFAKLSFLYAVYSLLPFGKLDGTKIFFGSYILWSALVIIALAIFGIGLLAGL